MERMANENDYPTKLRNLGEELRFTREKLKEAEDRLRKEDRNSTALVEKAV